jgi:serine/threonine protein kinase
VLLNNTIKSSYIGDLGLAISVSETDGIKDVQGVMPFLAPELLSGHGSYSQATDVYAFGIIMWEISSHEKPFDDFNHDKYLALKILKGFRPTITDDTPPFYRDLMQKCWHADPTQRPTADEIEELTMNWGNINRYTQEIKDQIKEAEDIRLQNTQIKKEKKTSHPGAIYTSRLLSNITKGKQHSLIISYKK